MRSSRARFFSRILSEADCLSGTGAKGLKLVSVEGADAFSGAMVEISSLGPKSKPKLKLVSKSLLPSFASVGGGAASSSSVANSNEVSSPEVISPGSKPASSDCVCVFGAASVARAAAKSGPSIARASSISLRKLPSAESARAGKSFSSVARATASHVLIPVVSAMRSSVSIVVLPMPRGGELTTRESAIEPCGFWTSFQKPSMSLISARS